MPSTSRAPLGAPPLMSPVTRPSTVDLITVELRNAIYSGALRVGSPIREIEIAGQLGVSRGPLREAAQRLVQEGLLASTPGRGLSVVRIGPEKVPALYAARLAVETHAARLLVRHGTDAAIATVRAAYDALVEAGRTQDARRIGDADLTLHWTLVSASGNPYLRRYMSSLIVEVRIASYTVSDEYVVRKDSPETHATLVDLLEARDEDGLVAALTSHLDAAVARLLSPRPGVETLEEPQPAGTTRLEPIETV
ncbi:GntR family transcriptional regulator [Oerskovia flava]|uniref:GntR family transcriptional regulator n=1 Tax=Oerskovia flava TaxID=2986422 RepID=UPI00223F1077|nr:GntR family transcriptional regulator [Oerskovia sp. JB1-3-2]